MIKIDLADLLLFYKIVFNLSCVKMPAYLVKVESLRLPPLRSNYESVGLLDHLKYKSTILACHDVFKTSYFIRTSTKWNNLPLSIRSADSFTVYKSQLSAHLWLQIKDAIG